ncbi:MAG: DUF3048 domain-containing protein [Patescibacteria group bacterium]
MEGTRIDTVSVEKFIKRSWPMLVLGAVLILAASVALFWFAVSGKARKTSSPSVVLAATSTDETVTSTPDLVPRSLDGVLVPVEQANLQPFAVMVENYIDARPLSGPAEANLAFEFPVEGGITRFMLVFDATSTVDQIGPVRSARPYFVDMADSLNAVYAHVGGSPQALANITTLQAQGFRNLDQFANGKYFWRSDTRVAPHNAYTRMDLLNQADAAKSWKAGSFHGWSYKEDYPLVATATTVARGEDPGPKILYGGSYNVSWSYDRDSNMYVRSEGGALEKDLDGAQVKAKNVVVLETDDSVIDSDGRLNIRTTGKGKAELFHDGREDEITWSRSTGLSLQFQSLDGSDVLFDRGTTWVEVVTNPAMYNAAVKGTSFTPPPITGDSTSSTSSTDNTN